MRCNLIKYKYSYSKDSNELYRNQFRFIHRVDVTSEYEVKGSDIKDDNAIFNYTIVSRFGGEKTDKFSKTEIDSNNGKLLWEIHL